MECVINQVKLHYEIYGEGRPVLMIHGWPVDHSFMVTAFEPIFTDLENWQRIYFDLPGMGNSSTADWIKTHDDMLQVVLDFIDYVLQDKRFHLVGLSYGAYLARGIINRRSTSIDGVMLYLPMIFADQTQKTVPEHQILFENPEVLSELRANNLEELIVYITDQNEELLENLRTVGIPSIGKADHGFLDSIDFEKELSLHLDQESTPFLKPTLILVGRQDSIVGYQDAWRMIDNFPRATFAALDYAGHALGTGERNTIFRALVNDWFDRLERERSY